MVNEFTDPNFYLTRNEAGEPIIYFDDTAGVQYYIGYNIAEAKFQLVANQGSGDTGAVVNIGGEHGLEIQTNSGGTAFAGLTLGGDHTNHPTALGGVQGGGRLYTYTSPTSALYFQDAAGTENEVAYATDIPLPKTRSIQPQPMIAFAAATTKILPAVGTGHIGYVGIPFAITVSQLRYNIFTAGSGGSSTCTVRCVLYAEDCQTLLIDVTEALNTGTGVRSIAVSNVVLPAGCYFMGIGLSATTLATQPTPLVWATTDTFKDGGAGHIDLEGTMVWTAGAAPATFDPEADITPADDTVVFAQLQGAAI